MKRSSGCSVDGNRLLPSWAFSVSCGASTARTNLREYILSGCQLAASWLYKGQERMPASSTSAMVGHVRSRSSRIIIHHSSSRFRELRPESVEFYAIFSLWERDRSL